MQHLNELADVAVSWVHPSQLDMPHVTMHLKQCVSCCAYCCPFGSDTCKRSIGSCKAAWCHQHHHDCTPNCASLCKLKAKPHLLFATQDDSVSVREAAVDLLGKHISARQDLALVYFDILASATRDQGTSVRKRAINIMWESCIQQPGFERASDACVHILGRISDSEESIQKLVSKIFHSLWFSSGMPSHCQAFGFSHLVPCHQACNWSALMLQCTHNQASRHWLCCTCLQAVCWPQACRRHTSLFHVRPVTGSVAHASDPTLLIQAFYLYNIAQNPCHTVQSYCSL